VNAVESTQEAEMQKGDSMRNTLIGFILLASAGTACAQGLANLFGAMASRSGGMVSDNSLDHTLLRVAAELNKSTPVAVDKDTRLDRISVEPGNHLTYHYTLIRVSSNRASSDAFRRVAQPQLKTRVCESPEMQRFLKSGVTIAHRYRGSDGGVIGNSEVKPAECIAQS
jgi:hypothetical protein